MSRRKQLRQQSLLQSFAIQSPMAARQLCQQSLQSLSLALQSPLAADATLERRRHSLRCLRRSRSQGVHKGGDAEGLEVMHADH